MDVRYQRQPQQRQPQQRRRKKTTININRLFSLFFIILLIISLLVIFVLNKQDSEDVSGRPTVPSSTTTPQPSPSTSSLPSIGVVVIDPGHGGFDVGTLGSEGMKNEDELNLAVSLKVGKYLAELGITPIYTRSDDGPVADNKDDDMQARVDIINSSNALLAVSIHMNSFVGDGAQWTDGPEVYYYDGNASTPESEIWAQNMQAVLNEASEDDREHKASNLMVLRETNIPAILIECGFLSCPTEEVQLNDEAYQDKLAKAIANCIYQNLV